MNYSYGNSDWKDLLTGYNGTAISYDLSGNPLNWRNANALTWNGRRLSGMTLTDGTELAFEYNSDGLRTGKTVGNSTVQYIWNEGNLIAEIRDGYTLKFLYNNGEAAGFSYNGADYYYGKDSFGVIRYLYNTSGEVVTTYTYDAWGTVLSVTGTLAETVGTVNPVRYKSYYLDSETGWYYLQSRYYDPAVGRFLNADIVELLGASGSVISYNLFVYCYNNPIILIDSNGEAAAAVLKTLLLVGVILTIAYKIAAAIIAKKNYKNNKRYTTRSLIHNQNDSSMKKLKYGTTTIYNAGCGVIAVHNALCLLNKNPDFASVIYDLDVSGYVFGYLGASIFEMNRLLKKNKIATKMKFFPKSVDSTIKNSKSKMAIIAYKFGNNGHYICVRWKGNEFELYNEDPNCSSAPLTVPSLDSYMKAKKIKRTYLAIISF